MAAAGNQHTSESFWRREVNNSKKMLASAALAALGIVACAPAAHASFAYAYAEQTLTNVTVTGAGMSGQTPVATGNTAASAQDGTGISTNATSDTPQAYLGAPPPAPQNDFTKYSTAGGGPQAGDFVRADAVLAPTGTLFTTGTNTSAVAESILSNSGLDSSVATWQLSGSFNSPTTSSVTVSYGFANDIIAETTGTGTPQANFAASITIKDQHGHQVKADPTELNSALSAPPNGPEIITSGTSSTTLSLAGLTAGDTYSINIVGSAATTVTVPAVPEPATAVLGLGALAGLSIRRRRAR
jgi:hypothetical protein